MKTVPCVPLTLGVDTILKLSDDDVADLCSEGMKFAIRYLESLTAEEAETITNGGLGLMAVTYADQFDGAAAVAHANAVGLPAGVTLWLDVESTGNISAEDLIVKIDAWARTVIAGGYQAGIYVGNDSKLTSAELTALVETRYWHSGSRVQDRYGAAAEPSRGWGLIQLRPDDVVVGGVKVDVSVVQLDYNGSLPMMAVA